jgi:hypothetical protein
MRCEHCNREITQDDVRERYEKGDRDQPSYYEPACRFCSPSEDDHQRALDAHYERLIDEARENGWAL